MARSVSCIRLCILQQKKCEAQLDQNKSLQTKSNNILLTIHLVNIQMTTLLLITEEFQYRNANEPEPLNRCSPGPLSFNKSCSYRANSVFGKSIVCRTLSDSADKEFTQVGG